MSKNGKVAVSIMNKARSIEVQQTGFPIHNFLVRMIIKFVNHSGVE